MKDSLPLGTVNRTNRVILYGGISIVFVLIALSALSVLAYLRESVDTKTMIVTQNIAKSQETAIEKLIDKLDISLQASTDEIERQIASGKVDVQSISKNMELQGKRLSGEANLRGANEHGELIYGPGALVPPAKNNDRDYFIRHRDNPNLGLVIVKPVFGRIVKKWLWVFARRINKPDGSFAGVTSATIALDQLDKMFSQMQLGEDGVISPGVSYLIFKCLKILSLLV